MIPGLLAAAVGLLVAFMVHSAIPAVPLLTAAVVVGFAAGQIPALRPALDGRLRPGLALSARILMRIGIVLLGLRLSLLDIAGLGFWSILATVLLVIVTFFVTWWMGRMLRLPGDEPLLVAAGFSVCGASAIGAMGAATRGRTEEQATPVALGTRRPGNRHPSRCAASHRMARTDRGPVLLAPHRGSRASHRSPLTSGRRADPLVLPRTQVLPPHTVDSTAPRRTTPPP